MSDLVRQRVLEHCKRLQLTLIAARLDGLIEQGVRDDLPLLDFIDLLLREETAAKAEKRVRMGIQIAHFPVQKTLEEFDYNAQPSVDRRLVQELATGRFVANASNVLLFGPPGVGKTHLAIGLGRAVVKAGYSVLFVTATELVAALDKANAEGRLAERLAHYGKPKLLIIDELGYLPFDKQAANLLFQLVAKRYEKTAMLITTNQAVTQWGAVFGDEMIAAAILDRLLHHSYPLVIQGESYRMREKRRTGLWTPPTQTAESRQTTKNR
jgi:DNA replication protein DnaC